MKQSVQFDMDIPDHEVLSLRYPAGSAPDSRKTIPWDEMSIEVKVRNSSIR